MTDSTADRVAALLPCPFCGSDDVAIVAIGAEEPDNEGGKCAACRNCQACTFVAFPLMESVDEKLAEAWNRRATATDLAERLALCERDAERLNFIERTQDHIIYGKSMKYGEGWYVLGEKRRGKSDYAWKTLREAIDDELSAALSAASKGEG